MVILTLVHAVTYNSRSLHVDATPKVEAYFKINGVYEVVSVGGVQGRRSLRTFCTIWAESLFPQRSGA